MSASTPEFNRWLQTCLRDLVEPGLTVDGSSGPRTTAAVKKFQKAQHLSADGVPGPATIAALEAASNTRAPGSQAAVVPTNQHTMAVAADTEAEPDEETDGSGEAAPELTPAQGGGYEERRVRVATYGTIPASSPLLVAVPGSGAGPKRLHVLAAQAMTALAAAIQRDLGIELKVASAWRAHRWTSREQYEAVLVAKYGSVKEGKRWLGFDSPHETGLAMDIGVGGLKPSRASVTAQRKTPLHQWLVNNAGSHGWHPYKTEPWHWEYPMSLEAYSSGVVGPDDPGPPEDALSFSTEDEEYALEDADLEELPSEDPQPS